MNDAQKVPLWLGAIAILAMAAVPPWIRHFTMNERGNVITAPTPAISANYQWICDPPTNCRLDLERLVVQWIGVLALMGAWYWSSRDTGVAQPEVKYPATPQV